MYGLRRKIKIPNEESYYLIFQKPWTSSIGMDFEGRLNYVIVYTEDFENYEFIDEEGEDDGFETYQGAEQFLRAYVTANYDKTPHRWYINVYPKEKSGELIDQEGHKHDF